MTAFNSITEALEELVPPFDAAGDWGAILQRAEEPTAWRCRPRLIAGVIALAVLVALLATPAFGVQGLVLHLLGRKNVSFSSSSSAPNEVKANFEDLSRMGAPGPWAAKTLASEARTAGTFVYGGHRHALYVVPTTQGGYCWQLQDAFGGCRPTPAARRTASLGVSYGGRPPQVPGWPIATQLFGDVTNPATVAVTVHYADGSKADVPFIWVSKPIDAGFFAFDVPQEHRTVPTRVTSVTSEARGGRRLGIQTFKYVHGTPRLPPRPIHFKPQPPHRPKAHPPVPPTQPVAEGAADGYRAAVGHNGAVQFTQVAPAPALARFAGRNVSYECFRLTSEFGIFTLRSEYVEAMLAAQVGFRFRTEVLGGPADGCQIGTLAGHRWPDANGSHVPVEIPFTAAGRAYFASRAAARDLALFVRTRRVQQIRHEPAAQAIRDLRSVYGKELAKSAIRMSVENGSLVFAERSTTGRLFTVVVRDGKIVKQNVRPLAFVF